MRAPRPPDRLRDDTLARMASTSAPVPRPSDGADPLSTAARTIVTEAARAAWALVAPVSCAGCAAPDRALCPECAPALTPRPRVAAMTLGTATVPVIAALDYVGVAREVLLALKEHGRTDLARALAPATLAAVRAAYSHAARWRGAAASAHDTGVVASGGLARRPLLVTVPGSRAAFGRRGYHPTALLARAAHLRETPLIAPSRGVTAQKTRSLDARRAAVTPVTLRRPDLLRPGTPLAGRPVIVFDDVVTSGATLQAAARALHEAGAEVVACAAVMATLRRHGESSIRWSLRVESPDDFLG